MIERRVFSVDVGEYITSPGEFCGYLENSCSMRVVSPAVHIMCAGNLGEVLVNTSREVTVVSPQGLGFPKGHVQLAEFFAAAERSRLSLCPLDLALWFRIRYDQPQREVISVAMIPVEQAYFKKGLVIGRGAAQPYVSAGSLDPERMVCAGSLWLFAEE